MGVKFWWFKYIKLDGWVGLIVFGNYPVLMLKGVCIRCVEVLVLFVEGIDLVEVVGLVKVEEVVKSINIFEVVVRVWYKVGVVKWRIVTGKQIGRAHV